MFLGLYLIDLLSNIECITVFLFFLIFGLIIVLITHAMCNKDMFTSETDFYKAELLIFNKLKKITIVLSIILGFLCFMPSRTTATIMIATHIGKKQIENVITPERLDKINKIIDAKLDNLLKEQQ